MSDVVRRLQRLELLARLIRAGTETLPWCGKVALQKFLYMLQEIFGVDLGYRYSLYHLGPYSPDLADDLGLGEAAGRWMSWDESFSTPDGRIASGKRFKVERKSSFPKNVRDPADRKWQEIHPQVEIACRKVRGYNTRELELIATLHYLRKVEKVEDETVASVLLALKPKFTEEEVENGLIKLRLLERNVVSQA